MTEPVQPSLAEELKNLEEIVRRLERDDTDLDDALRLFEDGIARLKRARERLAEAEQAVKVVLAGARGTIRSESVDL